MTGPLDGVRVLELATAVAGPYCGRLLAGLGADVIKVEPPGGDWTRCEGPFPGDVEDGEKSGLFLHLNARKRGALLPGFELEHHLAGADVLLLSHQRRDLAAQGIDIGAVMAANPPLPKKQKSSA